MKMPVVAVETNGMDYDEQSASLGHASHRTRQIMHLAANSIASLAVVLALVPPAFLLAQEPGGCSSCTSGCGSESSWPSDFGSGGFCPADWFTVPDSCPSPRPIYESPRRRIYGLADGIALKRSQSGTQDFAMFGSPGPIVLSTQDLEFEYQGGVRGLVGMQMSEMFAVEGSYFGILQWDESQAIRDTRVNSLGTAGNLFSPFSNFGVPRMVGFDYNTTVSIRVESSLENAELNLRQVLDTAPSLMQATVLYGFRYINIDEKFEYRSQSFAPAPPGSSVAVDVNTGNRMFGFQLGTMLEFNVDRRCWLNGEFKAGIFHNTADQNTNFTTGPLAGPPTTLPGGARSEVTTFMLDGSASVMYQFSRSCVVRAGYQAVWLDGVALATENFSQNATLLGLGPTQLAKDGSIVYFGPFAGLMMTW